MYSICPNKLYSLAKMIYLYFYLFFVLLRKVKFSAVSICGIEKLIVRGQIFISPWWIIKNASEWNSWIPKPMGEYEHRNNNVNEPKFMIDSIGHNFSVYSLACL